MPSSTPWVLPKNNELPVLSTHSSKKYHLPIRTPEDDAKVLRPCQSSDEIPCKMGMQCTAVIDIPGNGYAGFV